ncbi:hypothetical protein [Microvirga arsenatis]|uniref:CopL family metal-binding regulatory protein n=1 Tax=Microvirga arsenatis TaxID=2692265 RepID=A0ABW9Z2N3_9HYPH|nr:hypothetical protein [Microvirga arsenatis]NBJ12816.1 hypothetical protein [Microvirga arsenatis]NBJ26675.1 hypothetical protein [Microvirga arsenatis]
MSAAWIHFRLLVTSLMLVAVASFVLHSGVLAGMHRHGQGPSDCQQTASAGTGHQHAPKATMHVHQAAHDHGDGVTHHHAKADVAEEVAPDGQQADAGTQGSCCASACPIAMAPLGLSAISAPRTLALSLVPGSQRGSGIDPGQLKRPPRTPSIA